MISDALRPVLRVLFTGSRTYDDKLMVRVVLNGLLEAFGPTWQLVFVHGAAPGLDQLVHDVATGELKGSCVVEPHPADWPTCDWTHPVVPCPPGTDHRRIRNYRHNQGDPEAEGYCPLAGFRRNQLMADLGAGLCSALVDKPLANSRGTNDMVERAARAGIDPIHVITTGGRP